MHSLPHTNLQCRGSVLSTWLALSWLVVGCSGGFSIQLTNQQEHNQRAAPISDETLDEGPTEGLVTPPSPSWPATVLATLTIAEDAQLEELITATAEGKITYGLAQKKTTCTPNHWSTPLAIDAQSGLLTGIPSNAAVGDCRVVVTAATEQTSIIHAIKIVVTNTNDLPHWTSTPDSLQIDEEESFAGIIFTADDADIGETAAYAVESTTCETASWTVPLDIDSETGELSGTPGILSAETCEIVVAATSGADSLKKTVSLAIADTSSPPPVVNTPPTFAFVDPVGTNDAIEVGLAFAITWTDADPDNDAQISLYYHSQDSDPCNTGTPIGTAVAEDDETDSTSWVTTGVTEGQYFICTIIDDGDNPPVETFSDPIYVYETGQCTWVGFASQDWATGTNWVGCPGGNGTVPLAADSVVIFPEPAHQPLISSDATITAFGPSPSGGGILIVSAGATLTITDLQSVRSSVELRGDTDTCSTCVVRRNSNYLYITNGATLTLGSGLTLRMRRNIYIGDTVTKGTFVTDTDPLDSAKWPRIAADVTTWSGLTFRGAAGNLSAGQINGLVLVDTNGSDLIYFYDNYHLVQLDNVELHGIDAATTGIRLRFCSTALIDDRNWDGLGFHTAFSYSISTDSTCNGESTITVTGSGKGYGENTDLNPINLFNWTDGASLTCTWNGTAGSDWTDPANWDTCLNGRGNYPRANDSAIVPLTGAQPTVSAQEGVWRIGTGSGGGTVTIMDNAQLAIGGSQILSDITFVGGTTTCTNCRVVGHNSQNFQVLDDATLTLGKGITFAYGATSSYRLMIGSDTQSGHLVTTGGANPAEWPSVTDLTATFSGINVEGPFGTSSTVNIDGLNILGYYSTGPWYALTFDGDFEIIKLDRMTFTSTSPVAAVGGVGFDDCTNGTFTDTAWDEMNFTDTLSATGISHNVDLAGTNCAAVGPITMTGSGNGYGETFDNDPADIIQWN